MNHETKVQIRKQLLIEKGFYLRIPKNSADKKGVKKHCRNDYQYIHKDYVKNKYYYEYMLLVKHRRDNPPIGEGKTEEHHVISKSMDGPLKDSWNLVNLTLYEHCAAHILLALCTKGKSQKQMKKAHDMMTNTRKNKKVKYKLLHQFATEYAKAKEIKLM